MPWCLLGWFGVSVKNESANVTACKKGSMGRARISAPEAFKVLSVLPRVGQD